MKKIIFYFLFSTLLFASKVNYGNWESGLSFSEYLESRHVPSEFLESIPKNDRKFITEVLGDTSYYELVEANNTLVQALIPIGEEMQIHLFKNHLTNRYGFDIIPIEYKIEEYYATVVIENNVYSDTNKTIGSEDVAKRVSHALRGVIDATKLKKGDEISFTYTQKRRLGRLYAKPDVQMVRVSTDNKTYFIYVDDEGYGYKEEGSNYSYNVKEKKKVSYKREVKTTSGFRMPVRHVRVTSHFSYKRWHPIHRRYRPHHGTDFGGKRGTPLYAVGSGKISFSGWKGGYGKVVQIKHANGFESLYAHMNRRKVSKGKSVQKGDIIGYMGSTGRSTGPHLHFGLKRKGKWVNPMRYISSKKNKKIFKTFTKTKEETVKKFKDINPDDAIKRKEKLIGYIESGTHSFIWTEEMTNGTI